VPLFAFLGIFDDSWPFKFLALLSGIHQLSLSVPKSKGKIKHNAIFNECLIFVEKIEVK
jgi:hypothetical protein